MKTLIVYASKYGCTADCAKYLQTKLSDDVTLVDIEKTAKSVELSSFDTVIIGGSVYISKVSKKLRAFCDSNLDTLLSKKIGIFLCCALTDQSDEFLKTNFPATLLDHAVTTGIFGSEARLDKMSFLNKTIIKTVTKGDFSSFKISHDNIDKFIQQMEQQ